MNWRALRILTRRLVKTTWRSFRTALNVSWLTLRDPSIGWLPKVLGAGAAFVGILPLEWVPRIHPITVLLSDFVVVPALIGLAWLAVTPEHKEALTKRARGLPIPWAFFALIAVIFVVAMGVDNAMEFAYPGQDAFSPVIDGWVEDFLSQLG